jgi:hypothetical protein|tara:strand:+ start:1087 stop:1227 length:141 start_codon:yes stop_codon:yes gene_type:complete
LDEVILVDVLQLESGDIVYRFEDLIEKNFHDLEMKLEEPYRYDSYD